MANRSKPQGTLVAEIGDFKFYIHEYRPKTKRGSAGKRVTVVNKKMIFDAIHGSTHTVGIGFHPPKKS